MKKKKLAGWGVGLALLLLPVPGLRAQWSFEAESGLVWSGYNDVRIPGDGGTLFSLSRDLSTESGIFIRARLTWQFHPRHAFSVLYAPLVLKAAGSVDKAILYNGETFAPGTPLAGRYMFNSYRLTYRYTLIDGARFKLGIGLTAKIRDAGIRIEGGGKTTEKTNVGFVPLINFRLDWRLSDALALVFEGDALAAPQGRAEDVFLGLGWEVARSLTIKAGYRFVEGGSDGANVYNFTWVNYASLGAIIRF